MQIEPKNPTETAYWAAYADMIAATAHADAIAAFWRALGAALSPRAIGRLFTAHAFYGPAKTAD